MPRRQAVLAAIAIAAASAVAPASLGVINFGTRQVLQPADYLPGGRAQFVGRFGQYLGTPISPKYFVTANHIGNAGGGQFFYRNGTTTETQYTVTLAGAQDDLAIWQISGGDATFATWAPIYTRFNEAGKPMQAVGRGADKGPSLSTSFGLIGWFWGPQDAVAAWGTNTVTGTISFGGPPGFAGQYLYWDFDQGQGDTECIVAVGDSGGPVFITDPADGILKLAGTITGVDGGYSGAPNGSQFSGALFDTRGLYLGPTLITGPNPIPASSYAVRLANRLNFLRSVAGVPPLPCPSDMNADRTINTADLTVLLSRFGQTVVPGSAGDVNEDGVVNTTDLTIFLAAFGTNCP